MWGGCTGWDGVQYKGTKTVKIMAAGNAYQSPKRCQSHNENREPKRTEEAEGAVETDPPVEPS